MASILATILLICLSNLPLQAQEMSFFRIGTGGIAGTYYPIGGLIADIISNPPGARPCEKGGSCGVTGLVAIAQSSNGSVANIEAIANGSLESGFAQSDIAYWRYSGTGIFQGQAEQKNLRTIASLFPESIHLVVRKDTGIDEISDLRGKRISLDEPGSGTLVDALIILEAYGMTEADIQAEYLKPSPAIAKMIAGELDAFIIVAGYPTGSVVELAASVGAKLLPIQGPEADHLIGRYEFFARDEIPAGTYQGIPATSTISVGAQWLVGAEVDDDLVYGITAALWHDNARKLLDNGHAKASAITLETALDGVGIPLHPGAERYYREAGLIP